jgi:hypothetical protein
MFSKSCGSVLRFCILCEFKYLQCVIPKFVHGMLLELNGSVSLIMLRRRRVQVCDCDPAGAFFQVNTPSPGENKMQRFRPIFLTLTLIITLSSAAQAGNIGGLRTSAAGNIGGLRTNATGNIGGLRTNATGNIGGLRTNATGNIGGLRTNATGNIGGLRTNATQGNIDIESLFWGNIAGLIRALLATSALV